MGKIKLDSRITGQMKTWGNNYDSMVGCSHDSSEDKIDSRIDSKSITLNIMSKMDVSHAKPASANPGVDKAFLAKGNPQTDTVEGFTLTRKCKD